MSFWDKVKGWFGGGSPKPGETDADGPKDPDSLLAAALRDVPDGSSEAAVRAVAADLQAFTTVGHPFASGDLITQDHRARLIAARHLDEVGFLAALGFEKTDRIYHPRGSDPAAYRPGSSRPPPAPMAVNPFTGQPIASRRRTPAAAPSDDGSEHEGTYRTAPSKRKKPSAQLEDPYEAHDILGLSPEETRRRSLKIRPWATAWIGRVDTIPPQSDERTALIDRGLILRGLLTQDEIREIHRVGDAWISHHEAHRLAKAAAAKSVDAYFEEERALRAERTQKRRDEAEARREARREAIEERFENDIVFLGRDVSHRLHDRRANVEALAAAGLPFLATPADVAAALDLSIGELRHLAYHAEAPTRTHYTVFEIPKRSGGVRLCASPHRGLRHAQGWIRENVLAKLPLTEQAHGFVPARSTVTNARAHVGKKVVVNLDLRDFFPSITFPRVRGLFESVGYSPCAATILTLLVTEAPRMKVESDGEVRLVAAGDRALPQGACTSPAISNLVARKLDRRLAGLAHKLGFAYTRYADDLTFSADSTDQLGYLLCRVRHIVAAEGFALNEKKGRVQRRGARQEVTGVVVNERLSAPREEIRALRAILHDAAKNGLAAANRAGHPHFRAHLLGRIGYVQMIEPERGKKLRAAFDALPA
jgi:retron-type reverse transcriptase